MTLKAEKTLFDVLNDMRDNDYLLSEQEAMLYLCQISLGLKHLH